MKFVGNNPNGLNLVSKSLIELDIDGQSKVAFSNEFLSVAGNITASQNIKAQNISASLISGSTIVGTTFSGSQFTGSFSGSFIGDGGGLTNITQIASGSTNYFTK